MTVDYKTAWAAVESANDLPKALEAHFAFLVDTPACKKLLAELCAKARSATVGDEMLQIMFEGQDGKSQRLTCLPPFTGTLAKDVPDSYARFVRVHNGMGLDNADVGLGFAGAGDDGRVGSGGFEREYLEESDPELYAKLEEQGLMIEAPIDYNQDWVVYNPLEKTKLGEPTLHDFSHEGGPLASPYPTDLGIGGVWLRIIAHDLLGTPLTGA